MCLQVLVVISFAGCKVPYGFRPLPETAVFQSWEECQGTKEGCAKGGRAKEGCGKEGCGKEGYAKEGCG